MSKLLLTDCNNKALYNNNLVKIEGYDIKPSIYKIQTFYKNDFWFLKNGVGWIFDLSKYKITKI